MSQNFPTFNFAWVEDISQFTEVFRKNFDEKKSKSLFLAQKIKVDMFYT